MAITLLAASAAPGRCDVSFDDAVKAAYLPRFILFITWPDGAFSAPSAPITICILGDNPFGDRLERAASGARAGGRVVQVHYLPEPDPSANCQLLFIGAHNDPALVQGTLEALKGRPVVTVTDVGLKAHGVISFVIEANHVRFDIDEAMAAEDGLAISSKLLNLAHAVRVRGRP